MHGWPRPDQIPRIAKLGMIAGATNKYILRTPEWVLDYGEQALEMVAPRKSMIDAQIMNGFEIDAPLENTPWNMFLSLYWSIARQGPDGEVYAPHQRIGRELALKTATIWGAHYVLKEQVLGSLERGKFADFLVLDRDYLTIPERDIPQIRILMTVVGGKVEHLVPTLARELGMRTAGANVELGGPAAKF
jgi:predicted amidohydrolase YtcJ